ncbi:MAG: EAL domain-containing protein [Lachnospiraceae bacterium]|nr:EAL domain-containing protein [Lachnospiraceae bacterium]
MIYFFALCIVAIVMLLCDSMYRSYSFKTPMGNMLGNASVSCVVVVISYAVNYLSSSEKLMALFCCIQDIGIVWSFYFLMRFSVYFAEKKPLNMTLRILSVVVVMLDSAIILTSPINGIAFAIEYRVGGVSTVAVLSPKPFFLVHCFICFLEVITIIWLIGERLIKSARIYAAKYVIVIVAVLFMAIPEAIFALDKKTVFDYSVFFFGIAGALLCYAVFTLPAVVILGNAQNYLSEFMPGVVAMYDNAGVLINSDKRATDVMGRDFPHIEKEMRELLQIKDDETKHIMHGGREFSVSVRRICDRNGLHVLTAFAFTDVTESSILIGKEHHNAITDPLTGINNRAGFFEQAEAFLSEHDKDRCYAIMISSVNGFKDINRLYGTKVGDNVLKQIASKLTTLRGYLPIVFGRIAESKFSLLVPFEVIGEVVDSMSTIAVQAGDNREICVDMRHGFVTMDKGLTLEDYFELAIVAFVNSKKNAGVSVVEYSDNLREEQRRRQTLIQDVRKAIDNRDIVIDLRPHINFREHRIIGAKAWACWDHPVYGRLDYNEFARILEEGGFTAEFNRYVWREAAATLERFSGSGLFNGYISVELDKENILRLGTADKLVKMLREYGLTPDRLHLVIRNCDGDERDQIIHSIEEFRRKGFYIEEADFGKGVTNVETFLKVPFDGEIIGINIIRAAYESARPEMTAASFISAFTRIGIDAIVVGVDTREDYELIEKLDVKIAEGKYFAEAIALREFAGFVRRFNKSVS